VISDNFDVARRTTAVIPVKDKPPLMVDTDRPLSANPGQAPSDAVKHDIYPATFLFGILAEILG